MHIKWLASAFLCTGLMYCGGGASGGSGVDGNTAIGDISATDAQDLCEYLVTLVEPRTVTCVVEDQTITINFGVEPAEVDAEIAECVAEVTASTMCNATVAQAEACAEGNANQISGLTDDEICAIVTGGNEPPPIAACAALDVPECDDSPTAAP